MPFLLDGYNVYHAACKLSEELAALTPSALCTLVAEDMHRLRDQAVIVFDGRPLHDAPPRILPAGYVRIIYSGPQTDADSVLEQLIQKNTAPRRLIVVSSDNQLRRAARRRRANPVRAADYLLQLFHRRQHPPPAQTEPPEKRRGLPAGELRGWLELFGLDPDAPADPPDPCDRINF